MAIYLFHSLYLQKGKEIWTNEQNFSVAFPGRNNPSRTVLFLVFRWDLEKLSNSLKVIYSLVRDKVWFLVQVCLIPKPMLTLSHHMVWWFHRWQIHSTYCRRRRKCIFYLVIVQFNLKLHFEGLYMWEHAGGGYDWGSNYLTPSLQNYLL